VLGKSSSSGYIDSMQYRREGSSTYYLVQNYSIVSCNDEPINSVLCDTEPGEPSLTSWHHAVGSYYATLNEGFIRAYTTTH